MPSPLKRKHLFLFLSRPSVSQPPQADAAGSGRMREPGSYIAGTKKATGAVPMAFKVL